MNKEEVQKKMMDALAQNVDEETMEALRKQQLEQYTWAYPSFELDGNPIFLPKYVIKVSDKGRTGKEVRKEQLYKFLPPKQQAR